jgi:hypothetical protein
MLGHECVQFVIVVALGEEVARLEFSLGTSFGSADCGRGSAERVIVGGKKTNGRNTFASGLPTTEQDYGLAGLDPLRDLGRRKCEEVADGGGEDVSVGGKDFGVVLV